MSASANSFQIFVKGVEGKTFALNGITPTTKVSEVKQMIFNLKNIDPAAQRLIFTTKELVDNFTMDYYGITHSSTLHMVLRLLGGNDDDLGMGDGPSATMSCGHTYPLEFLTEYCTKIVKDGGFRISCPHVGQGVRKDCDAEWECVEIRKLEILTKEDYRLFEVKIGELYTRFTFQTKNCPKCSTCCERREKSMSSAICLICSRVDEFAFCWYCLTKVKESGFYKCENQDCLGFNPNLAILKNAPKVTIDGISNTPKLRACPKCGTIIEHAGKCKHMSCPCKHNFWYFTFKKERHSIF